MEDWEDPYDLEYIRDIEEDPYAYTDEPGDVDYDDFEEEISRDIEDVGEEGEFKPDFKDLARISRFGGEHLGDKLDRIRRISRSPQELAEQTFQGQLSSNFPGIGQHERSKVVEMYLSLKNFHLYNQHLMTYAIFYVNRYKTLDVEEFKKYTSSLKMLPEDLLRYIRILKKNVT